jgi:radical SAM protein with 4Fe4S-binding SPASM domain
MDDKNRPAMKGVTFEVTAQCNLKCKYCYNIHKAPLGIAPATGGYRKARKVLKQLFRTIDVERVTMTGGEPFLQERFLELVLFCRMAGKRVVIISNGTAGVEHEYRQLKGMGVSLFELPFHSTVAAEHDRMAGVPGSHEKAQKSIRTLQKLGAYVVPVIVVTKINMHRVPETLKRLRQMGLKRIMLNRFNIGGSGIANADELSLSIFDLKEVFRAASDTALLLGLNVSSNVCSPVCVLDGKDFPGIRFSRCSPNLEHRSLTMDLDGNLRFCNHSPVTMGNIYKEDIHQIIKSDYAASWKERPPLCIDCDKWARCYGGCRAASEQLGQSLKEADPILQGASGQVISSLPFSAQVKKADSTSRKDHEGEFSSKKSPPIRSSSF